MCRIVGIWDFNAPVNYDLNAINRAMRDSLAYGGPDHAGEYVSRDDGLALGHRRLSILDLSPAGNQPFIIDHLKMVFNGECYNFRDVRQSLEPHFEFQSNSDTEVLLRSILKNGYGSIDQFRGMFAFAVWDDREKKLTLVRDRLGVKPLYWYFHDGLFMFASELKAFHEHPRFNKQIDHQTLGRYLRTGFIESPYCIFKHVRKLSPGQMLTIDANKDISFQTYWDAQEKFENTETTTESEENLVDILDEKLTDSVMLRTVSDVPVGMFLSGGIDSTIVAGILQKNRTETVKTFTIGFSDASYSEADQAELVAKHLGTDHHELVCSEDDFVSIVRDIPYILDEPMGDSSIIPTLLVSKLAREHVKVSLSGDGGDEFFGGYTKYEFTKNYFPKIQRFPKFMRWPMHQMLKTMDRPITSRLIEMSPFARRYRNLGPKLKKFANAFDATTIEEFFRESSSFMTESELTQLLPNVECESMPIQKVGSDRIVSYLGLLDVKRYLEGDILCKIDRATMQVALEGREPLLDHQLLEFAFSLPDHLKIRGNQTKYLLRKVLDRYVPSELTDRPKTGFAIPIVGWLKSTLLDDIKAMANCHSFIETFEFDETELQRTVNEFVDGKGKSNPYVVWYLYVLYLWFQKWI